MPFELHGGPRPAHRGTGGAGAGAAAGLPPDRCLWLRWYYRKNGVNYPAGEKKLEKPLYDNYTYAFCTVLQGACMEVFIDGESILQWQDDTYRRGTIIKLIASAMVKTLKKQKIRFEDTLRFANFFTMTCFLLFRL